uniref:Adaptor protein ClpS core domain-containing protein n=1 Tax=Grammatophora oceanica TaxID=210454 RepID=A0A7S1YDG0_9STRA|mmetsp:Transcript_41229/g.61023  ORF Transcript_41229/g.61023 Transcript_41229/m.61023 type:complete len:220 (+) Transcript_41229:124-783(+)
MRSFLSASLLLAAVMMTTWSLGASAFTPLSSTFVVSRRTRSSMTSNTRLSMSTVAAPPGTETETRRRRRRSEETRRETDQDQEDDDPIEYLQDDMTVSRLPEDPFHILLLSATFEKPKVTVSYVASCLQYVLDMPYDDAKDAAVFCKEELGMACLGTWTHELCLKFGRQLQQRDLNVRVVPYTEGGTRSWQSKDGADGMESLKSANIPPAPGLGEGGFN